MKRPQTSHSYYNSGHVNPRTSWEAEDSLSLRSQKIFGFPHQKKGQRKTDRLKMPNSLLQQPTKNHADFSSRNGANLKSLLHGSGNDDYGLKDPDHFYLTSHKKDFIKHDQMPIESTRPMTTQFCQKPLKDVKTLYQDDFNSIESANVSKSELANWPKRNNPHPLEEFTVWRFPRQKQPIEPVQGFDLEAIERASKGLLSSTYKTDFLGMTQGARMEEAIANTNERSNKPRYSLDSTTRDVYQKPQRNGNLKNNTTRYGCNSLKHIPATGAVPNVFLKSPALQQGSTTKYSEEFTDKSKN